MLVAFDCDSDLCLASGKVHTHGYWRSRRGDILLIRPEES
jgi:hypothetical protein